MKTFAIVSTMVVALNSTPSQAQLEGLPGLGSLSGDPAGSAGLLAPLLPSISGAGFFGGNIPVFGPILTGDFTSAEAVLGGNPVEILPVLGSIGLELGDDFVPVLGVLVNEPASLADYFFEGGTLLTDGLGLAPPIPLLTAPLDF